MNKNITKWFSLDNTHCVIAGSEGLIGKSCVEALLDCGAHVLGIDSQAESQTKSHDNYRFQKMDITCEKSLESFFKTLQQEKSKEYFFINASYPRTENWAELAFLNVKKSDWNKNIELHLASAFHFSQLSVDFLKANSLSGGLINFTSIYALHGPNLQIYSGTKMNNPSPYAAIKAGIIGLTNHIATSFGEYNIRANTIAPGGVWNHQPESFVKNYIEKTPLRRMAEPRDIAGAIAFLVSPSARYITGQTIYVDGGWTSW